MEIMFILEIKTSHRQEGTASIITHFTFKALWVTSELRERRQILRVAVNEINL